MDDVARISTLAKIDLGIARDGTGFGESVSLKEKAGTVLFGVDTCKELGIFSVSVELYCWMVKGFTVCG